MRHVLAVAAVSLFTACARDVYSPPPRAPIDAAPADIANLESTDGPFAFDLLTRLEQEAAAGASDPSTARNVLASPYALRVLLAMIYADEQGVAGTEIAAAARFQLPEGALDQAFNAVDQTLAHRVDDSGASLVTLRRSVWWQEDQDWHGGPKNWFDELSRYYGASIRFIDLGDQTPIDDWVKQT